MSSDITQLVERYNALTQARENIDQQLDWIKSELRKLGPGSHPAGAFTVTVSPNRRLDEAKVTELYPVVRYAHLYVAKPDPKKIRAALAPNDVDALMSEVGAARVVVK